MPALSRLALEGNLVSALSKNLFNGLLEPIPKPSPDVVGRRLLRDAASTIRLGFAYFARLATAATRSRVGLETVPG